jgi:hypothetical protein
VAKKKALSPADCHKALSDDALAAMRTYKDPKRDKKGLDGLAAAIVFSGFLLGCEFPDWVKDRLIRAQLKAIARGGIHRQNKLRRKMDTFEIDLIRYMFVVQCDPAQSVEMKTFIKILNGQKLNRRESVQLKRPPAKRSHRLDRSNKFEDAFEQIQGGWVAPKDSSGMRQSYSRVQRMFRSNRLANYVAYRVVEAMAPLLQSVYDP